MDGIRGNYVDENEIRFYDPVQPWRRATGLDRDQSDEFMDRLRAALEAAGQEESDNDDYGVSFDSVHYGEEEEVEQEDGDEDQDDHEMAEADSEEAEDGEQTNDSAPDHSRMSFVGVYYIEATEELLRELQQQAISDLEEYRRSPRLALRSNGLRH